MIILLVFLIYSYGAGIFDYLYPDEPKNIKDEAYNINDTVCRIYYINDDPSLLECGGIIIQDNKTIESIIIAIAKDEFKSTENIRQEIINRILIYNASRYDETNPRYKYLGKVEEFACRMILGDGIRPRSSCIGEYSDCLAQYVCRSGGGLDCDVRLYNLIRPLVAEFINATYNIDPVIERLIHKLSGNIDIYNYENELNIIKSNIRLLINHSKTLENNKFRISLDRSCLDCFGICFPIVHNTSELEYALNRTNLLGINFILNLNRTISSIQKNTPIRLKIYKENQVINKNLLPIQILLNQSLKVEDKYTLITRNINFSKLNQIYNEYNKTKNIVIQNINSRNITDIEYYKSRLEYYILELNATLDEINNSILPNIYELEIKMIEKYYLYNTLNPDDLSISIKYSDLRKLYNRPIDGDNLDSLVNRTLSFIEEINNKYNSTFEEVPGYFVNIYWIYKNIQNYGNFSPDLLRLILSILSSLFIPSFLFVIGYIIKTILTDARILRFMFFIYIILIIINFIYAYYSLIPTNQNIYTLYETIMNNGGKYIIEDERFKECMENRTYYLKQKDRCISKDLDIECSKIEINSVIFKFTTDQSNILILGSPINQIYININTDDMNRCKYVLNELENYVKINSS